MIDEPASTPTTAEIARQRADAAYETYRTCEMGVFLRWQDWQGAQADYEANAARERKQST